MGHYLSSMSTSSSSSSETLDPKPTSQPISDPSSKLNITKNPQHISTNVQEQEEDFVQRSQLQSEGIDKNADQQKEDTVQKSQLQSEGIDTNGEELKDGTEANGDEEEEGECGFCLFMKGGGCKDSFVAWEKCIEEAEKNKEDIVDKCFEVTGTLKKCMEVHSDYYTPILQAEKAAEAELEREKEKEGSEASSSQVSDQDNVKVVQKDRVF